MDSIFQVHLLNEVGIEKAKQLAEEFDALLTKLTEICGSSPSREFSLVKTNLEIASFYAKKAMAMNPVNQKT